MIANTKTLVNKNQGSSLSLPAHGWVGARATSLLAAHFALRNTASNSAEKRAARAEAKRFRSPKAGRASNLFPLKI